MSRKRIRYHIAACFDTETTNIPKYDSNGNMIPNETRAICILYIFNDLRMKNLKEYEPDKDDKVSFLRTEEEAQQYIVSTTKELSNAGEIVISEGKDNDELIAVKKTSGENKIFRAVYDYVFIDKNFVRVITVNFFC